MNSKLLIGLCELETKKSTPATAESAAAKMFLLRVTLFLPQIFANVHRSKPEFSGNLNRATPLVCISQETVRGLGLMTAVGY